MFTRLWGLPWTKKGRDKKNKRDFPQPSEVVTSTSAAPSEASFGALLNVAPATVGSPSIRPELRPEVECKLFKSQPAQPVITDESCCTTLDDNAVEQAGTFRNAMLLAQSVYTRSPSSSPSNSSSQLPSRLSHEARPPHSNRHGSVDARSSAYQQHSGLIDPALHTSSERLQHQQQQQQRVSGSSSASTQTTSASSIGSLLSSPQDFTKLAPSNTVPNSDSQLSDDQPVIGKYQRISMQHAQLREHVRLQKEQERQGLNLAPVIPTQPTSSLGNFKRSSNPSARFSFTSSSNSLISNPHSSPQNLQPPAALLPLSSVLAHGSSSNTCSTPSAGSSFSLAQAAPVGLLPRVGETQEDSCAQQQQQQPSTKIMGGLQSNSSLPLPFGSPSQAQSTLSSLPSLTRKRIPPADILLRTCALHKTELRDLGISNCEEYTQKVVNPLLQLPPVAALVHRVLDAACGIKSVFAVITYNRPLSTLFPPVQANQAKLQPCSSVDLTTGFAGFDDTPQCASISAVAAAAVAAPTRNLHFTLRPCVCQDDSAASFSSRFVPGLVVSFCSSPI